ncbi:MAG: MFS transporter [Pseudomonadota bacterium]
MMLPGAEDRAAGRAPLLLLWFLALLTSIVALSIDAVLPALDAMDRDLGFATPNDRHKVVMVVFAGLALAQLVTGPLADALGRKPVALAGLGIYLVGTAIAGLATEPWALFAGRFLQGFGAAGPRVVSVAIARDLYEGRPMARIVSLVSTIFMLVPMLAPLVGQGLEALGGWRMIFAFYAFAAVLGAVFYIVAMPETLPAADRRPLRIRPLLAAWGEVLTCRQALLATGITISAFGSFTAYLAMAQQIFEELYGLGALFPIAFAGLAAIFAAAAFANGRLVMRLGMRRLTRVSLVALTLGAAAGALASATTGGVPPFWLSMGVLSVIFASVASVFGNMTAFATEPLGHVAGTATSFVLATSTLCASGIGSVIAAAYDGSLLPLFAGFAALGLVGLALLSLLPREPAAAAEGGRA